MTLVLMLVLGLVQTPVPPATAPPEGNEFCVRCHGDRTLAVTLPSGEVQHLYVDAEAYARSVHGNRLTCTDCHADTTDLPHVTKPFRTSREFTIAYYEQCKRCHFANYTKTIDSVHYAALARGDRTAPVCVDCHGAHDVMPPGQPRTKISETCARCHAGVSGTYVQSVHGRALVGEANGDVPVCTDCHRSHDIAGPREQSWRLRTPELCGTCHTNATLMEKYGLSTRVLSTYVADFHGMTASLKRSERTTERSQFVALCTDCHGVHDIMPSDSQDSPVMRANLLKTCQRCHPGASENFPAAWLGHYEPSWERAPLVYAVKLFYAVMIPFMIGGLVLQILLHLWRVVVNR